MKNSKPLRKWLIGALFLALLALTCYGVFKDNSLAEIWQVLRTASPWYAALGLALAAGNLLFQGLALRIPMRSLGAPMGFFESMGYSLIGFYYSGVTPSSTGGQPMQLYYMCRRGHSVADASLGLLVVNIAYQLAVMVLGGVMLVLRYSYLAGRVGAMAALIIFGYTVAGLLTVGLFIVTFSTTTAHRIVNWVIRMLARMRLVRDEQAARDKAEAQLARYAEGASILRANPRMVASVMGTTLAQICCNFLIPFCAYRALGLQGQSALDLLAIQAVLFMAVSYLPLPGAMGVSEKGFVTLFSVFFTAQTLVPGMLLSRVLSFYLPFIASAIVSMCVHIFGKHGGAPQSSAVLEHAA